MNSSPTTLSETYKSEIYNFRAVGDRLGTADLGAIALAASLLILGLGLLFQ